MKPIQLHGTLHVTIYSLKGLNTTGQGFTQLGQDTKEKVGPEKGVTNLLYATIDLEKGRGKSTRIMKDQEYINLGLNEPFHIYCAHTASDIVVTVKNDNSNGTTSIGRACIHVKDILDGMEINRPVKINLDERKKPIIEVPKIYVKLQYFDATRHNNWNQGIAGSPKFSGVPKTYFRQQQGCKVSLYQDAHVPNHFAPKIPLAGGKIYQQQRCWEDVFDAINNAKYIIYITGWSLYTEISLVRDPSRPKPGGETTLGELLKKKAEHGVMVLILVWNDKSCQMSTHHKKTVRYFNNTKVHCVPCSRQNNGRSSSFFNKLKTSWVFTHHQKTLVVDSELSIGEKKTDKRRIVSFVGGIDLCDGRYDTQLHSLFRTLGTVHRDDFHQPNFPDAAVKKGGPREPWHDIHARLEGPIAWDVLTNFEQRWEAQGKKDVKVRDLKDIIIPQSPVLSADDNETWNVQLFRSTDAVGAASDDAIPKATLKDADAKDYSIDRSIQDAYINAIRRARNFIYIESQYFLGSSFAWSGRDIYPEEDASSLHLIPKELSLKIVSKIKAKERFTVYIVVPMWPESVPGSYSVQEILYAQRRTMEMMYKDIVDALNEMEIKGVDLRNYLTFFCLGNREVEKQEEYRPSKRPKLNSDYMRAQQSRRFMIYVHSKMMIVDDEYIIVGSANINQRSMDGARDSEIAIGGYQPHHINTSITEPARGQIHGFRMSLWYEHLGILEDCFLHPESEECVKRVNQLADQNWDLYSSDTFESDLPGHLLRYPVEISSGDGSITELPEFENFPDTQARVLGNLRGSSKRKHNSYFSNYDVFGFQPKLRKQIAPIFFFQP